MKYYCDNVFLGIAQKTDKDGNKVEQFIFNGVIPKDKFFVMGTHPRSFDSRYWGFVDKKILKEFLYGQFKKESSNFYYCVCIFIAKCFKC
ncbi:S26 family signal peptidase [Campylobacter sp. TTU-622]|uniref:S26 family signal peptidase n=1 Tax=Campylobacter sp. TTU-622 TaxID=2800583 RepID=UPI002D7F9949|nr:S26 family signal peptidase [Campylobacter sp. TTU-622]